MKRYAPYKFWCGNLRERDHLEHLRVRRNLNGCEEIGWRGVEWTKLAQDRDMWRDLVNTVMKLRVALNARNLLTGRGTIAFSTKKKKLCSMQFVLSLVTALVNEFLVGSTLIRVMCDYRTLAIPQNLHPPVYPRVLYYRLPYFPFTFLTCRVLHTLTSPNMQTTQSFYSYQSPGFPILPSAHSVTL
jgi:hypothetical protein